MRKKINIKRSQILNFFCCPLSLVLSFGGMTFVPGHRLEKKYSNETNQFFYLQKKFQKIMTKTQPLGACPKSHLSLEGAMVL